MIQAETPVKNPVPVEEPPTQVSNLAAPAKPKHEDSFYADLPLVSSTDKLPPPDTQSSNRDKGESKLVHIFIISPFQP